MGLFTIWNIIGPIYSTRAYTGRYVTGPDNNKTAATPYNTIIIIVKIRAKSLLYDHRNSHGGGGK